MAGNSINRTASATMINPWIEEASRRHWKELKPMLLAVRLARRRKTLRPPNVDAAGAIQGGLLARSVSPWFAEQRTAISLSSGLISDGTAAAALCYFSAVWTEVKVVTRLDPTPVTTAMIATEMPAAMRPYSMAVAPDSSRRKRVSFDMFELSTVVSAVCDCVARFPFTRRVRRNRSTKQSIFSFN
jgi:hypothetical protein